MKKAYLGIDIGSISTKGVIIDEEKNILAGIYLWTEGNPMGAAKKVIAALGEKIDQNEYQVVAAGTTGSARKLVGADRVVRPYEISENSRNCVGEQPV